MVCKFYHSPSHNEVNFTVVLYCAHLCMKCFLGISNFLPQDNHNGVVTHLEPDILKCEVKWTPGSITTIKASGSDGIPAELFQILTYDAVKVLHLICYGVSCVQPIMKMCSKGRRETGMR